MKYYVTFKEITKKTIGIEVDNQDHAQIIADEMLDNIAEIDFEKNPDYYDVYVESIKKGDE